jgi:hypothetical protein
MPYSKLFIALLLSTTIGAAHAADSPPQADAAPAKVGDYQPVGFLSSYAGLTPDPNNEHAFIKRAPAGVAKKYNKVMIDRIKVFFEDGASYKGIDPTDLKALTDYFHNAIVKALDDTYPVVDKAGPDVIRLRIAVTNVVPNKPLASVVTLAVPFLWLADAGTGVAQGETGSTAFVGKASVEMEALDSVSSKQLAAYIATEVPTKYNWVNGINKGVTDYVHAYTTWSYTKDAMDIWAKYIRERMDVVHGK